MLTPTPRRHAHRRGRRPSRRVVVPAAILVVGAAVGGTLVVTTGDAHADTLPATGPADGALLSAKAVHDGAITVDPAAVRAGSVHASIDGRDAPVADRDGSPTIALGALAGLGDGKHTIVVTAKSPKGKGLRHAVTVHVDTVAPTASVTAPTRPVPLTSPVTVSGSFDATDDTVTAPGGTVKVTDKTFTVAYEAPPAGAQITVADPAGNTVVETVTVPTTYPNGLRAVHVTGAAWGYAPLRNPILALAAAHKINAIELDIKDEGGVVNFDPHLALATQAGAVTTYYDPVAVAKQLHGMGIRLVGRVVAFNDTKLANWAWATNHRDWVIQNPDGTPYTYGYAKSHFTNFANPNVVGYDSDLAAAAVKAGFDDVIFDYVRRPDGPIDSERFPGLPVGAAAEPAAEKAVAAFVATARAKVRPLGGSVGAAIFAQAARRPQDTAQNVPLMAKSLDVVVPMDYPSHWNPGEYGVPDPYADPRSIVNRSLADWQKAVKGTDCVVVPWLQDENYKGAYTPAKVMAQIQGTRDVGIPGWLMWSAGATYQAAAYTPDAPTVYVPRRT